MRIELIEQTEDPLVELRVNPNSIVADKDNRLSLWVFQAANLDAGRRLGSRILCGIIDQILHNFHQPDAITVYNGKISLYFNLNLPSFQLTSHSFHSLLHDFLKRSFLR